MPTISVDENYFGSLLGVNLTIEKLEALCFEFGIEYDGSQLGPDGKSNQLRIDIPANRYDLLSVEGLALALRKFMDPKFIPSGISKIPEKPIIQFFVKKNVDKVRPWIVAAILRNVSFNKEGYASFIDLQDKLCSNLGRRRKLVAMGTYDLDCLKPPFVYDALAPQDIHFVPLGYGKMMTGAEMLEACSQQTHLKPYCQHLVGEPLFPVLYDNDHNILSVPPIINSDACKISADTKNILIDCTTTDLRKANWILDTFVATMSLYSNFQVEPVQINYDPDHSSLPDKLPFEHQKPPYVYPALEQKRFKCSHRYIQKICGVQIAKEDICEKLLPKMLLAASENKEDPDIIDVVVPCYRNDVLAPCDIAEDCAIAYGFNRIAAETCNENANFKMPEIPMNALTRQVRNNIAECGFVEVLSWGLLSLQDNFERLRRTPSITTNPFYVPYGFPAEVAEPKTLEFQMCRTSLVPGILKALATNQSTKLPIRMFEIGDCVVRDETLERRTKTRRYVAAAYAGETSGLEFVHGLLDAVLAQQQLKAEYLAEGATSRRTQVLRSYRLKENSEDGLYFPGRSVLIEAFEDQENDDAGKRHIIGSMGIVHPEVLKAIGLPLPVSVFELSLEPFIHWNDLVSLYE